MKEDIVKLILTVAIGAGFFALYCIYGYYKECGSFTFRLFLKFKWKTIFRLQRSKILLNKVDKQQFYIELQILKLDIKGKWTSDDYKNSVELHKLLYNLAKSKLILTQTITLTKRYCYSKGM